MPSTGRQSKISVVKEASWGTYLTPTTALSASNISMISKTEHKEDPRLIGQQFTSDMIRTGEIVEGNIDVSMHPEEIGTIMKLALGTEATISTPSAVKIYLSYTGADAYASISITSGVWLGKSGTSQATATMKFTLDTATTPYDTASELATAINLVSGWKAYVFGIGSTVITSISDVTETAILSNGILNGYLTSKASSSTTVKEHHFSPITASTNLPSFSACVDATLGSGHAIGYSGIKVNTLKIDTKAGELEKISMGLVGKVEALDQTYPAVSPVYDRPYAVGNSRMILNGIEVLDLLDVSFDLNNNIDKPKYVGQYMIGEQISQGGTIQISGTVNLDSTEWTTNYGQYKADTPVEVLIWMQNATNADTGTSTTTPYYTLIKINNLKLRSWDSPITGPNRITSKFTGTAVFQDVNTNYIDVYVSDKTTAVY